MSPETLLVVNIVLAVLAVSWFITAGVISYVSWKRNTKLLAQAEGFLDQSQELFDSARNVSGYIYEQMDLPPPPHFTSSLHPDAQAPYFAGTITDDGLIVSNMPADTGDVGGLPPSIRADLERLLKFDWGDVPPESPPSGA